jgi:hypothetical protein
MHSSDVIVVCGSADSFEGGRLVSYDYAASPRLRVHAVPERQKLNGWEAFRRAIATLTCALSDSL